MASKKLFNVDYALEQFVKDARDYYLMNKADLVDLNYINETRKKLGIEEKSLDSIFDLYLETKVREKARRYNVVLESTNK
ncbi:MAG: hypothetical protein HQL46_07170 [Gammaproteobacteria bacterium]|nr:hypothetical protein [Gammaproteobacteria bacterium]